MGVSKRKKDETERRQHMRVDQRISIDMHLDSYKNSIKGETHNLSPAGVYCEVDQPIAEMTQLMIVLDLPDAQVECEGTVVRAVEVKNHSDLYQLAIFFHKISDEATQQLVKYLMG